MPLLAGCATPPSDAEALGKADQPEGSSVTLSRPELIDP
jgi:hypothetical protein